MHSSFQTRDLVLCGLCAALTCILAPLSIPLAAGVPISLATFAIMLSGVLLGGRLGALSQIIYVLLGAVGLPVFAGWAGGIGIIAGMTGGYILGYIPLAWITGLVYCRFGKGKPYGTRVIRMITGMVLGTAVLYLLGTAWFMFSTGMSAGASLAACVIPFLPGDCVKIAAVSVIAPPVEAAVRKASPVEMSA